MSSMPNKPRHASIGVAIVLYGAAVGMLGDVLGPILFAAVSDHFFGGGAPIGKGVAVMMAVCCPGTRAGARLRLPRPA